MPSLKTIKSPYNRSMKEFSGLMSAQESQKESFLYIQLTLQAVVTVLTSNLVAARLMINQVNFKQAALSLVHRLRISRILILLNLMNIQSVYGYLDSLDKYEAQFLLHNLQFIVSDMSVIDRFAYSTFEQVAYGIDTFHTVMKIKRLLKEPLRLKSVHICNHRGVGLMLDSYFQQHSQINFDLLMNALIMHY